MLVEVGRLIKAHGIKGEIVLESLTDFPNLRFAKNAKLETAIGETLTIERFAEHSGRYLVKFVEVKDRNAAESMAGLLVLSEVDPDQLPPISGKYFDRQLIGLLVVKSDDEILGKVTEVIHLPGQDMLVINSFGKEVLIPFVDEIVPEVDLELGVVKIIPPEGLLELFDEN